LEFHQHGRHHASSKSNCPQALRLAAFQLKTSVKIMQVFEIRCLLFYDLYERLTIARILPPCQFHVQWLVDHLNPISMLGRYFVEQICAGPLVDSIGHCCLSLRTTVALCDMEIGQCYENEHTCDRAQKN